MQDRQDDRGWYGVLEMSARIHVSAHSTVSGPPFSKGVCVSGSMGCVCVWACVQRMISSIRTRRKAIAYTRA